MGLWARLPFPPRTSRSPATLARPLQHGAATQLTRRPTPGQPRSQRLWARQLEEGNDAQPRVLLTRAPGYVLELDPDQVDLTRFELLARRGKHELVAGDA